MIGIGSTTGGGGPEGVRSRAVERRTDPPNIDRPRGTPGGIGDSPGYGVDPSESGTAAREAAATGGWRPASRTGPLFVGSEYAKEAPTVALHDGVIEVRRPDRVLERVPLPSGIEVVLDGGKISFPGLGIRCELDPDRPAIEKSRWMAMTSRVSYHARSLDQLLARVLPPAESVDYSEVVRGRISARFPGEDPQQILDRLTSDLRNWGSTEIVGQTRSAEILDRILPALFGLDGSSHWRPPCAMLDVMNLETESALSYRGALSMVVRGRNDRSSCVLADLATGTIERALKG